MYVLSWPKSLFGFLCTLLEKLKQTLELPNVTLKPIGKAGYQGLYMYFQAVYVFSTIALPSCYIEVPLFFSFLFFF